MLATKAIQSATTSSKSSKITKCFNNFKSACADIDERSKEIEKLMLNDTELCDTNLFAFLNDFLKNYTIGDKKGKLKDELRENESLSKELGMTMLQNHLSETQNLTQEILSQKGIGDISKVSAFLDKSHPAMFVANIVTNKLNDFISNKNQNDNSAPTISSRDIIQDTAINVVDKIADKIPALNTAKQTIKHL